MNNMIWIDLRNLIASEFSRKYTALSSKSVSGKQIFSGLTALFLLKDQPDAAQSEDIALLGHRIGFTHGDLFGPYFGLFKIGMAALRNIAAEADWHIEVLYEQGDGSYIVSIYA